MRGQRCSCVALIGLEVTAAVISLSHTLSLSLPPSLSLSLSLSLSPPLFAPFSPLLL